MKDAFKKLIYFGVGAVSVTAEKIEELVDELISKGEASNGDRARLIEEFIVKAKESEKEFTAKVKQIFEKTRQDIGIPTRREFEELKARVEALEKHFPDTELAGEEL